MIKTKDYIPQKISFKTRVQNAELGIPSDCQSVMAKVMRISEMRLSDYCTYAPDSLSALKEKLGVSDDISYREVALLIEQLFAENETTARDVLREFAMPLVCLSERINWKEKQ